MAKYMLFFPWIGKSYLAALTLHDYNVKSEPPEREIPLSKSAVPGETRYNLRVEYSDTPKKKATLCMCI